MTIDQWVECDAVESVPGRLSGKPVFKDTRVPLSALFENLACGVTLDEFLELFQGVQKWQVEAVLNHQATN